MAAQLRWLWVVVSEQVTFCDMLPGRGFAQATSLVGAEYDGWLTHDGWAVYYKFLKAGHQSCLSHVIRRCRDMTGPRASLEVMRVRRLGTTAVGPRLSSEDVLYWRSDVF